MVIPLCFSSGALSIWSKATSEFAGSSGTFFAKTFVIAAVRVVLPWSTCPMVPTFRCGLFLSNLPFAIVCLLPLGYLGRDALGHLSVLVELHSKCSPSLRLAPDGSRVTEHLREGNHRPNDLSAAAGVHALYLSPPRRDVAHDVAHELLGYHDLHVHYRL